MGNFRRDAKIDVRVDTTRMKQDLDRMKRYLSRAEDDELARLRRLQKAGGDSDRAKIARRNRIWQLESRRKKRELSEAIRHNKALDRLAAEEARRDRRAHSRRVMDARKRKSERRKLNTFLRKMEEEAARDQIRINRRKNRIMNAQDNSRRGRSMGLGAFGGVGPNGGFGYLMGGGAVGGAIVGGLATAAIISTTTDAYREQERAVGRLMSLVSDAERQQGFTWDFAREKAQRLAMTLGVEIPEAAIAMREAVTSAVDPFRAGEFVKMAQGLALSEGVDVGTITGMLATVRNAYELTGDEMMRLPDLIFTTMDEGRFKLSQVASQMGDLSGIARAVGFELKETLAAMGALTRGGMSSARAATSLRMLGSLIMKGGSGQVMERRKEVGLDLQATARASGLQGVLEELNRAVQEGPYNAAELLGGRIQALKGVTQLLGSQNDDFYEILEKQYTNVGRAARETEKLLDNVANRMDRFERTIDVGISKIGGAFVEVFSDEFLGKGEEFEANMAKLVIHFERMAKAASVTSKLLFTKTNAQSLATKGIQGADSGFSLWDLTGFGQVDNLSNKIGRWWHDDEFKPDNETQALLDANARRMGFMDDAAFQDHMRQLRAQQKGKEEMEEDARKRAERKAEAHEQKKLEIEEAAAKARVELQKKIHAELDQQIDKMHSRLEAISKTAQSFRASEAERLGKARLAERGEITPLEKLVRARRAMDAARGRAVSARTPEEAQAALKDMSKHTAAIRGMDLEAIFRDLPAQRSGAIAGLADILPEMPFDERMDARLDARREVEGIRDWLRRGRFGRGGLAAMARGLDTGVGALGEDLFRTLRGGVMDDLGLADRRRQAVESVNPALVGDLRTMDQKLKDANVEVAGSTKVVYDQPITVTQHFHGPADAEQVEDASTDGIKTALDRGAGNLEPNK